MLRQESEVLDQGIPRGEQNTNLEYKNKISIILFTATEIFPIRAVLVMITHFFTDLEIKHLTLYVLYGVKFDWYTVILSSMYTCTLCTRDSLVFMSDNIRKK